MNSVVRSMVFGAVIWVAAAGCAQAQVMVLSSSGPSESIYPSGAVLRANRQINLRNGDRLEVLDPKGSHVLYGPLSLTVNQIDAATIKLLKSPLPQRGRAGDIAGAAFNSYAVTSDVAATRGFTLDTSDAPTTLWQIPLDSSEDGSSDEVRDVCRIQGQAPALWRSSSGSPGRLRIDGPETRSPQVLPWPVGEQVLRLADDLDPQPDTVYTLRLNDQPPVRLRWRSLPDHPMGLTALARALAEAKCLDQLDALVEQLDPG